MNKTLNKSLSTKFFSLGMLVLGTFLLQACQTQTTQNTLIDGQTLDRRVGVLRSLGGVQTSNQGTHLLMLNNGNTILLKSVAIDLDDPAYRDKNVEVQGVLDYTTDHKQIMEVVDIQSLGSIQSEEVLTSESEEVATQETLETQTQESTSEDSQQHTQEEHLIPENMETQETQSQEILAGYSTFDNEGFGFSIQYPKSWYFAGSAASEKNVIRHYEFGNAPLEEGPGTITLDLMSGIEPEGQKISAGSTSAIKKVNGNTLEIYVKGDKRTYRLRGPLSDEQVLLQMASTLNEK